MRSREVIRNVVVIAIVGCSPATPTAIPPPNSTIERPVLVSRRPLTTEDVVVAVEGQTITMNGTTVSSRPMVADFEAIYGKPDRTWEK